MISYPLTQTECKTVGWMGRMIGTAALAVIAMLVLSVLAAS